MDRRELIRSLAAAVALPFVPRSAEAAALFGEAVHRRLGQAPQFRTLTAAQQALVGDVSERIIPATDTPGALDVRVPEFIDLLLTEWYDPSDRDAFVRGLAAIDERARAEGGAAFVRLAEPDKLALMQSLDTAPDDADDAVAAFRRVKSLTVYGYFTSERVSKDVLETQVVFTGYDGCAPFAR